MSIQIVAQVLRVRLGNPSRKVVAIKLADCAGDDGADVFPSVARIAAETELSVRTVQYVLRQFEAEGLLVRVRGGGRGGSGRDTTTRYRIDLLKLVALPVAYTPNVETQHGGAKTAPRKRPRAKASASSRGATGDSWGCSPCTLSVIDPSKDNNLGHSSFSGSARTKDLSTNSDFKKDQDEGKGRQLETIVKRAEGFGLDADEIVATVNRIKPRNRPAYFTKLCVNELRPQVPQLIPDQVIRDAIWGKKPAYGLVMQALLMVAAP